MKNFLNFILLISLGFSCSSSQDKNEASTEKSKYVDYRKAIDSSRVIISQVRENNSVPGMAVALSINGELVWSEGFGSADLDSLVPVDPQKTMFRIGSVSKPITSTALAILYERGSLNLDTSVQTYVPYFPKKKYDITVRQIAGHLAGIRSYKGDYEIYNKKNYASVKEGIGMFQNDRLLYPPNTKYYYSSFGYNLLSAVVEGASQQDFLQFMDEEVFKPLEMDYTSADFSEQVIPSRTKFYTRVENTDTIEETPYVDNSYKWAGGGFISSAVDLIKFGNSYLGDSLMDTETKNLFFQSQVTQDSIETGYGMGWKKYEFGEIQAYGHTGSSVGGITMFFIVPSLNLVYAAVSNCDCTLYGNSTKKIILNFENAIKNSQALESETQPAVLEH